MGRQGRGKKPEKLGTGKVTPVQVAFIVDRYLTENQYSKTLAEFRSEAAAVLGLTKPRQAPKSLLSLVDILDDYITLKEQRISLGQEKARMDQLLHALQEIIFAYQSGGMLPGKTNIQYPAASSPMTIPQSEVTTPISGPYPAPPASAATNPVMHTSVVPMERADSMPLTGNKRKISSSLPDASASAKKACHMTSSVNSSSSERIAQGLPMPTNGIHTNSQAGQSASHTTSSQMYPGNCQTYWGPSHSLSTSPVQHGSSSAPKSSYNQPSPVPGQGRQHSLHPAFQMHNDSACPQTPPQAFPIQTNTSASPLEASSLTNGNTSLGIPGTSGQGNKTVSVESVTDPEVDVVEIRSSENNFESSTSLVETPRASCKDKNYGSVSSPSKPSSGKAGKRGHIKGRLDFNSSVTTSTKSPTKSHAKGTATDLVTNDEMGGELFDLSDILAFDVADFEAEFALSDLLVDFELDFEGLPSAGAAAANQSHDMSSCDQNKRFESIGQKSLDSEAPLAKVMGVLTEKDMNRQVPGTVKASDVPNCRSSAKFCSNNRGTKIKEVADQENVPLS